MYNFYNTKGVHVGYSYSTMHLRTRAKKVANSTREEVAIKKNIGSEEVYLYTIYPTLPDKA